MYFWPFCESNINPANQGARARVDWPIQIEVANPREDERREKYKNINDSHKTLWTRRKTKKFGLGWKKMQF